MNIMGNNMLDPAVWAGFIISPIKTLGGIKMKDLSLMTWKEIKEVDKDRSIVFAVMAPIEEHIFLRR